MTLDRAALAQKFREFAGLQNHGVSILYETICKAVAADRDLLDLAAHSLPGQPAPNVLLAAVHWLLLSGIDHPLAAYYGSLTPAPRPVDGDTLVQFRDFCDAHRDQLAALIATRRTQTNEVNRSALLLPALTAIARENPAQPLGLIEIGPSAGLNMNWDLYLYEYGLGAPIRPDAGRALAPGAPALLLETALEGLDRPPLPGHGAGAAPFYVAMRSGIEAYPVDAANPHDRRWLEALTWPDNPARLARLRTALTIAESHPPNIIPGDAVELLPDLLEQVPGDALPIVYHTFALYQVESEGHNRIDAALAACSSQRSAYRIALEWIGGETPTLDLIHYYNYHQTRTRLAICSPHGLWLRWQAA